MISLGLIGCGDVAEHGHLPTILRHHRFRLAAVCDVNARRAELLADRGGGVPAYSDWCELLRCEKLDAVALALPPEVSPDVVAECLGRKLAVLDEKPLAATVAEGRRLARLVAESGGVYQIGFVLRYGDWVQEIRRLASALGSPLRICAEVYDEQLDPSDGVHFARIQSFLKNSSAITHEGSHVVDFISLWNSFRWTRVNAFARQTSPSFAGPNVWNAQVGLADHSTIDLKVAWLLPELPPSTITVEGPTGRLRFNCITGVGDLEIEGEGKSLAMQPIKPEWNRQYDSFARAIERGHVDFATIDDAIRALELTTACEMSARAGNAVTPADLQRHSNFQRVDTEHRLTAQSTSHVNSFDRASDVQSDAVLHPE